MNPEDCKQILDLLEYGALISIAAWVLLFVVIFIDQIRKGR